MGLPSTLLVSSCTASANFGDSGFSFDAVIVRQDVFPKVATWKLARGDVWVEERREGISTRSIRFGTTNGGWHWNLPPKLDYFRSVLGAEVLSLFQRSFSVQDFAGFVPERGSASISEEDCNRLHALLGESGLDEVPLTVPPPFASAPVRSRPRRTYDPAPPFRDPEGENVPMYLATVFSENKELWELLKDALEHFGQDAGLFDEMSVQRLGKYGSEPFQIRVRNTDGGRRARCVT